VTVRERADAARNRQAILQAAERLFDAHGLDAVSMDAVAAAAAVGKGTLFRRFGDRNGLARAVMERREAALRQAVENGPAPLGPCAPPVDRLVAFMDEVAALACRINVRSVAYDLCRGGRDECPYAHWHAHVTGLIAAARPDADAPVLAHGLLAAVDGALVHHLVAHEGVTPERVRQSATALARAVVSGG
jgi:AcrR family transcriptional regulator